MYWRCRQNLMRSFEVGITDVEGDSNRSRRMDCRHIYVQAKSPAHPLPDLHHECLDILQCVHHSILTDSLVIDTPTPEARASMAKVKEHRSRDKPIEKISLQDARKKEGVWPVVAPVTDLGTVP